MFDDYIKMLNSDSIYWFCALAGSGMFFIQFILNLVGLGHDHEVSSEGVEDAGKFKWLSRQALAGFLGMFGWVALACDHEFHLGTTTALLLGLLAGALTLFFIGLIFRLAKGLQSTGTVFRIEETVGKEALVYQRIPKDGVGKIQLTLHDFTREIDAVAKEELASFTRVKIIKIADDTTVVVTAL